MIIVTGKTFEHRDHLKSLGGRWNADTKAWDFHYAQVGTIKELRSIPGVIVTDTSQKSPPPAPRPIQETKSIIEEIWQDYDRPKERVGKTNFHGDDRSFINYFRDQNPIAYFGFSSLNEVVKYVERIPSNVRNQRFDGRNEGWNTDGYYQKWSASENMDAALKLARHGWPDGVDLAETIVDNLTGRHAIQRRRNHSIAGGSVNVGRMLSGNPAHMHSRPKRDGKRIITFFVEAIMSASIDPEYAIVRAAMVAAMVEILEMNGYSCEIVSTAVATGSYHRTPAFQVVTKLKEAGEPLNINDVVFGLGHPSYLRRLLFAVVANDADLSEHWSTFGMPSSAFTKEHPTATNEMYIKKIHHNHRNKISDENLMKTAFDIWDLITTDKLPITINREES